MAGEVDKAASAVKGIGKTVWGWLTSGKFWAIVGLGTVFCFAAAPTAVAAAIKSAPTATSLGGVFSNSAGVIKAAVVEGGSNLAQAAGTTLKWGAGEIGNLASNMGTAGAGAKAGAATAPSATTFAEPVFGG